MVQEKPNDRIIKSIKDPEHLLDNPSLGLKGGNNYKYMLYKE